MSKVTKQVEDKGKHLFNEEVAKPPELIFLTTDEEYNQIYFLPFNRDYKFRDDLARSFNEFGFQGSIDIIETNLIDGVLRRYAAEGQHRMITARRLGITCIGQICTHKFVDIPQIVKYVAIKNNTNKKWTPENYVSVYTYLKFVPYQLLTALTKTCAYSCTTVAAMLYGFRSRFFVGGLIETGKFTINLYPETDYTLELCAKLSKYGVVTARMALALHYVASLTNFDEAKFTAKYIEEYECVKELKLDDYTDVFQSWITETE